MIDLDRLTQWMDDEGLPGKGEPLEHRFISGGTQNEIYELRRGELLAKKQFVQGFIADSYAQLAQFRLFVIYVAWTIDKHNDYRKVRKDIAAVKVLMPGVLHDIALRAIQVHGALGVSNEMPFHGMLLGASVMGLADGPTEVHKMTVAKQVLRDYAPSDDIWPTQHLPKRLAAAKAKFAAHLDNEVGNL